MDKGENGERRCPSPTRGNVMQSEDPSQCAANCHKRHTYIHAYIHIHLIHGLCGKPLTRLIKKLIRNDDNYS